MQVHAFQQDVLGLRLAVPGYTVPSTVFTALKTTQARIPTHAAPTPDDASMVRLAQAAYGPAFKPLTKTMAKRLAGKTVVGLSGQAWLDNTDGTKRDRAKALGLITIHDVFMVEGEPHCCVSNLDPRTKKRVFTFGTYLWKGYWGSGSGHDPILICM